MRNTWTLRWVDCQQRYENRWRSVLVNLPWENGTSRDHENMFLTTEVYIHRNACTQNYCMYTEIHVHRTACIQKCMYTNCTMQNSMYIELHIERNTRNIEPHVYRTACKEKYMQHRTGCTLNCMYRELHATQNFMYIELHVHITTCTYAYCVFFFSFNNSISYFRFQNQSALTTYNTQHQLLS